MGFSFSLGGLTVGRVESGFLAQVREGRGARRCFASQVDCQCLLCIDVKVRRSPVHGKSFKKPLKAFCM